jgi:DNA polymerase-1
MSQDPAMISEYRKKDNDLHRLAASKVFGKDPADVTDEERSRAKMLNFGIVYGISAESIAARFAITVDAARQLLESFFAGFPGLRLWIEQTQEQVLRKGYVESLFGHRRHFPELKYAGKSMRQSTLRKAVNFPIQCTASNMAIYAEAFLSDVLREDGLKSYCFGQVHDEAWITGPIEELDQVARLTRDVCENLPFVWLNGEHPDYPETVPMTVDVKWGANLCDVQKYAF